MSKEKEAKDISNLPIFSKDRPTQAGLLSEALLREFMHKKKYLKTLKQFDTEHPRDELTVSSRQVMQEMLLMANLMPQMKSAGIDTIMEAVCEHRIGKKQHLAGTAAAKAELDEIIAATAALDAQIKGAEQAVVAARASAQSKERLLEQKKAELVLQKSAVAASSSSAAAAGGGTKEKKSKNSDKKSSDKKAGKRAAADDGGASSPAADEISLDDLLESNESHIAQAARRTDSMRKQEYEVQRQAMEQEKLKKQLLQQTAGASSASRDSSEKGSSAGREQQNGSGFRRRSLASEESSSDEDKRAATLSFRNKPAATSTTTATSGKLTSGSSAAANAPRGSSNNNNNSSSANNFGGNVVVSSSNDNSSSDSDDEEEEEDSYEAGLRAVREEQERAKRSSQQLHLSDENSWKIHKHQQQSQQQQADSVTSVPPPVPQSKAGVTAQAAAAAVSLPPAPSKDSMIGLARAASLVQLLCAANKRVPDSFFQPVLFTRNKARPYGLVQKEGGPCGAIAALQARLLVQWFFAPASAYASAPGGKSSVAALALAVQSLLGDTVAAAASASKKAPAAVELVLPPPASIDAEHFQNVARQPAAMQIRGIALCDVVTLDAAAATADKKVNSSVHDIVKEWTESQWGLLCFVLSVVMTRTRRTSDSSSSAVDALSQIQSHMDEPRPLIVEHGYCSQEMVNLFLCGWASSHVHDGSKHVGGDATSQGMELRGLVAPASSKHNQGGGSGGGGLECGYLSMMEVRRMLEVGAMGKNPAFPVWMIYNESHFTVLFSKTRLSDAMMAGAPESSDEREPLPFEVFYYDPQCDDDEYRLTVSPTRMPLPARKANSLVSYVDQILRTRPGWENARVSWNGATPLY